MTHRAPLSPIDPDIPTVLQEADRALLSLSGKSHYLLYRAVHRFAQQLAPLDSFYIGFCQEAERTIVYPYNFDGREYDDPNINPYQPGGVTEWIVTHKRPYWSRSDGGDLLHRGRAFGDTTRRSEEGIVVPLFERAEKRTTVIGLLSLLSYTPNVFSEETVWAAECLAESLSAALQREREDAARRRKRFGEKQSPERPADATLLLGEMGDRLRRIRQLAENLRTLISESVSSGDTNLVQASRQLAEECERSQTETLELLLQIGNSVAKPLQRLTAREQEVAALLTEGKTNRQIAERLFISEKTAKTHVGNIIQKLGAGGRSGVAQMLKVSATAAVYANGVDAPTDSAR
jgi:DNA-binding CsgD family transcriptional regulator